MKTIFYGILLATTGLRLAAIVYLQVKSETNLPMPVFVVTALVVLYGIVLLAKRFVTGLSLRGFLWFFIVQSAAFAFNIGYVAITTPLKLSLPEIVVTGSFLDMLIAAAVAWTCIRRMRSRYVTVRDL